MKENYSIDDILNAIEDLQNLKKGKKPGSISIQKKQGIMSL